MKNYSFEEAKQVIFEEAMQSTTLGSTDVDTNSLTYSLIPYLVFQEILLGAHRKTVFRKAFFETSLIDKDGKTIHVPVLDRDEFVAKTISEEGLDQDGYTKTKMEPSSVKVEIGDIIYAATKISDVLMEDSPSLGWVRASLQKMGEALEYKLESDLEEILYAGQSYIQGAASAGKLTYDDIIDLKAQMGADSWDDDDLPALLFINAEEKADILKEKGESAPFETERYQGSVVPFKNYPMFAGCVVLVSEVQRSGFATLVVPPTSIYGPSAILAWKRQMKAEQGRDYQYGRDVYILSSRYGASVVQDGVGLISNC